MLSDFNNFIAVVVIIGMSWFLALAMLDGRKSKRMKDHQLTIKENQWEGLK